MKKILTTWIVCICFIESQGQFVSGIKQANTFTLSLESIYVDDNDLPLVKKSAELLQHDIEMVTGKKPELVGKIPVLIDNMIIIGSIEKSSIIKSLVVEKKINVASIKEKWETYQISSIQNPFPGGRNALIITGSDRRGVAYGVFELS